MPIHTKAERAKARKGKKPKSSFKKSIRKKIRKAIIGI